MKQGSIKSTEIRNDGITAYSTVRKSQCSALNYAIINAKVGNFFTKLCCNTIISCFSDPYFIFEFIIC